MSLDLEFHLKNIQVIHTKQNRKWDKDVPYWIHPMWCATMILSEPLLDKDLRHRGAIALLYHDVIEAGASPEVIPDRYGKIGKLVREMTFEGFDEEMLLLMSKSDEVILLKLFDKVSNMLDGHWMSIKRANEYKVHTLRLIEHVKKAYGPLQICKFAEGLIF